MLMKNSILYMNEQLLGYWIEDLIWCPSQCYYYFLDPISSQGYCIYLRWRHSDPWTAELIKCTSDWEFIYDEPWEYIELKRDYSSNEYRSLEKKVLKVVKKRFSAVTFKNRVYEKRGIVMNFLGGVLYLHRIIKRDHSLGIHLFEDFIQLQLGRDFMHFPKVILKLFY